ncbi:MAG: beta-ketoacyl-ACP synthase III [Pseudonocardiaceae bacterium]
MNRAAVLYGVGSALPDRIVCNTEAGAAAGVSDEWIYSRTGIRTRRWVAPGVTTSDLAAHAIRAAVRSAGGKPDGIDTVVLATTTPDRRCPATAPTVASKLGLDGAAAFDVGAVCSGFVYALAAATGMIVSGAAHRVAVVGAEIYSTIIDPGDRATAPIFGDGAGAVLLRAGSTAELGAVGAFDLGSDGAGRELITIAYGGAENRASDSSPGSATLAMSGREVFWHAARRMRRSVEAAVRAAGWQLADVDLLVAHQASRRILDQVGKDLRLPPERIFSHVTEVGNTAAASIPLALDAAVAAGELRGGSRVVLTAFGGGLTWGSTTLRWPDRSGV